MLRNYRWTFDAEQFQQSFGPLNCCMSLAYVCVSVSLNSRSSLLYIEVWKIRWKLPVHQNRVVWSLTKSPMIFCLIWLLSYEWSISNPFQVWRNTGAGISIFLVLLQTQNRVVEIVVVHFVQLSFVNSLQRKSIQCLQIHLN